VGFIKELSLPAYRSSDLATIYRLGGGVIDMVSEREVRSAFPQLSEIQDEDLRHRVIDVWQRSIEESAYENLEELPWWPPLEAELDGGPISGVEHVRDVVDLTIAILDCFGSKVGLSLDRDTAIAGAILHDCSKAAEMVGDSVRPDYEFVPHPYYGVHALARSGCSPHLQHIVLSHSPNTSVTPVTMEAQVVRLADELAADALFWERKERLMSA